MEITTRHKRARALIAREPGPYASAGWHMLYEAGKTLDPNHADLADAVDEAHRLAFAIPGAYHVTVEVCSVCSVPADPMIRLDIGGEYNHDLCRACLVKALEMLGPDEVSPARPDPDPSRP